MVDAGHSPPDAAVAAPSPPAQRPRRRRRITHGRLTPVARPDYRNTAPSPNGWLSALRLQVSSRGPKLARCFEGTDRPGALRWRASLDVARGIAADHRFEPVLAGATLGKPLRRCLAAVLSDPPYRLPVAEGDPDGPAEVAIIIEF
jgi:hypothetical protein